MLLLLVSEPLYSHIIGLRSKPITIRIILTDCVGKFKGVENMVTSRIYIDDISTKGFEELVTNKDQHIKILVTTHKDKVKTESKFLSNIE